MSFHIFTPMKLSPQSREWKCPFLFLFLFIYCESVTIVCIFSPSLHPPTDNPTSLPYLSPPPWFCPSGLSTSSRKPFSPLSPPHSPLAIVTLFLISMCLVIFPLFFSFVDYVPVKGEIIWYLSLTFWLISLSIMLSSSIHAVAKGISSFFSLLRIIPLCKCIIVFWSTQWSCWVKRQFHF